MSEKFKERAYDYFLGQGYPAHAAAALAANATWESGGDPRISHDGGTGLGLFGWRDPNPGQGRKTNLINWAKTAGPDGTALDPYSDHTQLQFANHELNNGYKSVGDKLRAANDLPSAQNTVMGYLAPAGYTPSNPQGGHGYAQRYNLAAPLVGADQMSVPINGPGAGGQGVEAPTPTTPIDPRTAGDADLGGYGSPTAPQPDGISVDNTSGLLGSTDASQMKGGSAAASLGMSVASQASQQRPPQFENMQASMNQPKQSAALPDFVQQLAQERLRRKMGGM